jgi:hypothetical protein
MSGLSRFVLALDIPISSRIFLIMRTIQPFPSGTSMPGSIRMPDIQKAGSASETSRPEISVSPKAASISPKGQTDSSKDASAPGIDEDFVFDWVRDFGPMG